MISDYEFPKTNPRASKTTPMLFLVLGISLTYLLMLGFKIGGTSWNSLRSDLLNIPVEILLTLFLGFAIRLQAPPIQRLLRPLFWSVLLHVLANILSAMLEFGLQVQLTPNPIDLLYLLSSIILLVGLWRVPLRTTSRSQLIRLSLDVVLLVLTVGILFWTSFLETILQNGGQFFIPGIVGLSSINPELQRIPFNGTPLDLVVLCVALVVSLRITNQFQSMAIVITLGILSLVLIDAVMGAQLSLRSYQHGGLLDGGFIVCLSIFCIAMQMGFNPKPLHTLTSQSLVSIGWLSIYAPYLAAIIIYIPLIKSHITSDLADIVGVIAAAIITALVLVRQIMILRENQDLTMQLLSINDQLETRIIERSKELDENRVRLISSEKLASLGQLTAGLAHEVNTPLAASLNYLHQARALADEYSESICNDNVTTEDHQEIAKELQKTLKDTTITLERLGEFVRKMRSQTRMSSNEAILFDPVEVARDTLTMLEHQTLKAKIELELPKTGLLLRGEPNRFTQVLSNLVMNAVQACEGCEETKIHILISSRRFNDQNELMLCVTDNGAGIPEDVLPKIFEPLFTTKAVGKGTGLGLSIIRDIVRGHFGGEIEVTTKLGTGTTFNVYLPLGANLSRGGTNQV